MTKRSLTFLLCVLCLVGSNSSKPASCPQALLQLHGKVASNEAYSKNADEEPGDDEELDTGEDARLAASAATGEILHQWITSGEFPAEELESQMFEIGTDALIAILSVNPALALGVSFLTGLLGGIFGFGEEDDSELVQAILEQVSLMIDANNIKQDQSNIVKDMQGIHSQMRELREFVAYYGVVRPENAQCNFWSDDEQQLFKSPDGRHVLILQNGRLVKIGAASSSHAATTGLQLWTESHYCQSCGEPTPSPTPSSPWPSPPSPSPTPSLPPIPPMGPPSPPTRQGSDRGSLLRLTQQTRVHGSWCSRAVKQLPQECRQAVDDSLSPGSLVCPSCVPASDHRKLHLVLNGTSRIDDAIYTSVHGRLYWVENCNTCGNAMLFCGAPDEPIPESCRWQTDGDMTTQEWKDAHRLQPGALGHCPLEAEQLTMMASRMQEMDLRLKAAESQTSPATKLALEAYQKFETVRLHLLQLAPSVWNSDKGKAWHETGIIELQLNFVDVYLGVLIQEAIYNPQHTDYLWEQAAAFMEETRSKLWTSFRNFAVHRQQCLHPKFNLGTNIAPMSGHLSVYCNGGGDDFGEGKTCHDFIDLENDDGWSITGSKDGFITHGKNEEEKWKRNPQARLDAHVSQVCAKLENISQQLTALVGTVDDEDNFDHTVCVASAAASAVAAAGAKAACSSFNTSDSCSSHCVWHGDTSACEAIPCSDMDVRLSAYPKGEPQIYKNGVWNPVCGHYFWNNDNGATLICQSLGYSTGTIDRSPLSHDLAADGFKIGVCQQGNNALSACDGGQNDFAFGADGCNRFDKASLRMTCSGGNGAPQTCQAATTTARSPSYVFDGSTSYASVSAALTGTPNTFMAWIKVAADKGSGRLHLAGNYPDANNINWEILSNGKPRIYWNNGQVNFAFNDDVRTGAWMHVAIVRDTSLQKFHYYKNGHLHSSTASVTSTDVTPSTAMYIGKDKRGSSSPMFKGEMSMLKIFQQSLSESQVLAAMRECCQGSQDALLTFAPACPQSGFTLHAVSTGTADNSLCSEASTCAEALAADINGDTGYEDIYRGWYDLDGCGACNNYCRWVANCGSRGHPTTTTPSCSKWSCVRYDANAGSVVNTGDLSGPSWNYQKCSGKGAVPPNGQ